MPIMSAHGQNDARGTARLLALTATNCIRNPASAAECQVALNNVYRLLEAYRANAFFGLVPRATHFPPRLTEVISLLPSSERHVKDVRVALEHALADVFAGQSKDEAIQAVENVLRGITYPEKFGRPSDDDRSLAMKFFEEIAGQLNIG